MTARITPASLVKDGDIEEEHQAALMCWKHMNRWLAHIMRLHHIPNGAAYGSAGDARTRVIRGARMKTQGLISGVPDLFLPLPMTYPYEWLKALGTEHPVSYAGLYIEMKKPSVRKHRNGGCSDEQVDWLAYLKSVGYQTAVCYTWIEAVHVILDYYGVSRDDKRVIWE